MPINASESETKVPAIVEFFEKTFGAFSVYFTSSSFGTYYIRNKTASSDMVLLVRKIKNS